MLAVLIHALTRWLAARRDRAILQGLLSKDDRLLEDMGLLRSEIERALGLPLASDARGLAARWSSELLRLDARR